MPAAVAALLAFAVHAVHAAPLPDDTPLVVDGPITVDAADLEGYMLRVPETQRAMVRASYERVAGMVDNIFLARSLAAKARAEHLDQGVAVQRRLVQVQDALLADLYLQRLDKEATHIDLAQRAHELYEADQAKYVTPEEVHVEHLLVGLKGRTRDMALQRAQEIDEEAKAGKDDFLTLAAKYSDDPDMKRNGGDLGFSSPGSFVAPVAAAIAKMTKPGEISPPIESYLGFHIVRFVERKKPEAIPFAKVKKKIIEGEKDRLAKKRQDDAIRAIRESKTVVVHSDNVAKLVTSTKGIFPPPGASAPAASAPAASVPAASVPAAPEPATPAKPAQ